MVRFLSSFGLSFCFFALLPLLFPIRAANSINTLARIEEGLLLAEQEDGVLSRQLLHALDDAATASSLELSARASVELATGHFALADSIFHQALLQDPTEIAAIWGLAVCRINEGEFVQATELMERATALDPRNSQLLTLRAYLALLNDNLSDTAEFATGALGAGERAPLLMAVLAQLHYASGNTEKALEFGSLAARPFARRDLSQEQRPLAFPITLTGDIVKQAPLTEPFNTALLQPLPDMTISKPVADMPRPQMLTLIVPETTPLQGAQPILLRYQGEQPLRFVTLHLDGKLRELLTAPPFQFTLDAAMMQPGEHILLARAYNEQGTLLESVSRRVITADGPALLPAVTPGQATALRARMMALTMPEPERLSLYISMGYWWMEIGEVPQAIDALERAVALNPYNQQVTSTLQDLYRQRGLLELANGGEFKEGPATAKRIALTFDDGPNPLYVPAILESLARYQARATFFFVGKMVQRYPGLARDIIANGHEVANHTYSHPNVTTLTSQQLLREVLLCRSAIKDTTGRDTVLFRPPGGNIDAEVVKGLRSLNYQIAYWSINAGEYRKMTAANQTAAILARIRPGSILLLHCGPVDGTMDILPDLLEGIYQRGYSCVTVTELLRDGKMNTMN